MTATGEIDSGQPWRRHTKKISWRSWGTRIREWEGNLSTSITFSEEHKVQTDIIVKLKSLTMTVFASVLVCEVMFFDHAAIYFQLLLPTFIMHFVLSRPTYAIHCLLLQSELSSSYVLLNQLFKKNERWHFCPSNHMR